MWTYHIVPVMKQYQWLRNIIHVRTWQAGASSAQRALGFGSFDEILKVIKVFAAGDLPEQVLNLVIMVRLTF